MTKLNQILLASVIACGTIATTAHADDRIERQVYQDKNYQLRLTPSGASNTVGVYNTDNNFADSDVASEILALIYQNWPA